MKRSWVAALAALAFPLATQAALTGNVFYDGNFENNSYLKNSASYDSEDVLIPIQRFNQDADWGLWQAIYGVPSLGGGFSTLDYPRLPPDDPMDPMDFTRDGRDAGNYNISIDPLNASNHVLENIYFRPVATQWVKAPALQKPGPVSFSFDFNYVAWDPDFFGDFITVRVFGLNFQPQHNIGIMYSPVTHAFDMGPGSFLLPLGEWDQNPTGLSGQLIERFNWGGWFTHQSTNGWKHVSSDDPNSGWSDITPDPNIPVVRNASISQTFQYYAIALYTQTYDESSLLFSDSFGHGDLLPQFAMAFDNFDFRVTLALLADTNLDGLRNALDIQSFVARVTGSLPYMIEADCNQDGLVNALDIQKFVYYITGGSGEVVPEPAAIAWLALGAIGLLRRR